MRQGGLVLMFLWLLLHRAAAGPVLFAENFAGGTSNRWQNLVYFKTPTDYFIAHDESGFFLRGVANHAGSAFTAKLDRAPPVRLKLRWRWRIESVATNGSERDLSKFDHAARVFVAFDTLIGPPRTLNYLWGNREPAGTMLAHPKSGRAELFVVESGDAKAGRWVREERDVSADWERAFPGLTMPRVRGLGLMTDSDSLGMKLTGDYADIELSAE